MDLLSIIENAWGWSGLRPADIVAANDFGNLIILDRNECYWRLCPENLSCKIVANSRAEMDALALSKDFLLDWDMQSLVQEACNRLGPLEPGSKYCLKIPGVLGGDFGGENLGTICGQELIAASGRIAQQIETLPDGARVEIAID